MITIYSKIRFLHCINVGFTFTSLYYLYDMLMQMHVRCSCPPRGQPRATPTADTRPRATRRDAHTQHARITRVSRRSRTYSCGNGSGNERSGSGGDGGGGDGGGGRVTAAAVTTRSSPAAIRARVRTCISRSGHRASRRHSAGTASRLGFDGNPTCDTRIEWQSCLGVNVRSVQDEKGCE